MEFKWIMSLYGLLAILSAYERDIHDCAWKYLIHSQMDRFSSSWVYGKHLSAQLMNVWDEEQTLLRFGNIVFLQYC